ncbi:MAG: TetR family transcriptional regulator [Candidatus Dormibacterales bacterium]
MSEGAADPPKPGLRERKKIKTREAIQREAMRLFQKRGYDETTIEDIAEAVEISPSTFFNYFPSKEDVVLYDAYDPIMASMLLDRPTGEPVSVSIRHALEPMGALFERDREVILARARLWMEVPALQARMWEELQKAQDLMCGLVAERTGRDAGDFELRVVVMVVVVAAFEAMYEWVRGGGHGSFMHLVNRALDVVDAGARLDAITAPKPI